MLVWQKAGTKKIGIRARFKVTSILIAIETRKMEDG
jgi:hypothetical protein